MTEQEYKNYIYEKAKNVKTKKDLDELLSEVIESKDLCYGKIVYAICGCMKATMNYINNSEIGGITGFQAGFIGWEMIKEYTVVSSNTALKLINYDDMLFPQKKELFDKVIEKDIWAKSRGVGIKCYQELIDKHFIIEFSSNVIVIKHWFINNYVRRDRHSVTVYDDEYSQLRIKDNGAYTLTKNGC